MRAELDMFQVAMSRVSLVKAVLIVCSCTYIYIYTYQGFGFKLSSSRLMMNNCHTGGGGIRFFFVLLPHETLHIELRPVRPGLPAACFRCWLHLSPNSCDGAPQSRMASLVFCDYCPYIRPQKPSLLNIIIIIRHDNNRPTLSSRNRRATVARGRARPGKAKQANAKRVTFPQADDRKETCRRLQLPGTQWCT